jgi:DNA-binding CsgD family transcriptional regulator
MTAPSTAGHETWIDGLTRREYEVLLAVGQRMTNGEISDRLLVSKRTVESHISSLYLKSGASTRLDLVSLAYPRAPSDIAKMIDDRSRAARRALLAAAQRRSPNQVAFDDDAFLQVADRPTVYRAIVDAALNVGGAHNAGLQLFDVRTGVLTLVEQRSFAQWFAAYFASVDIDQPTAGSTAAATGDPVLIDDVTRSPTVHDPGTVRLLLSVDTRALYAYPLHTARGEVAGVLTFHTSAPITDQFRPETVAQRAEEVLFRHVRSRTDYRTTADEPFPPPGRSG